MPGDCVKKRLCNIDITGVSLSELNKSLAFYYGQAAFFSAEDKLTLHYHVEIEDEDIEQLVQLTKSPESDRLIDIGSINQASACCSLHQLDSKDIQLDNSTIIFDADSIECIAMIKRLYTHMANQWFSTHHVAVPNLIDIQHLKTAGYFEKFPAQAMLVSTLPLDPAKVLSVNEVDSGDLQAVVGHYTHTGHALNPVTCYHVYSNFQQLYSQHKAYRFTLEGASHRYEGKHQEAGRLIEFKMLEIVFFENLNNAVSTKQLIKFYKEFFSLLALPVGFKVSSDAFFSTDANLRSQMQQRSASKVEIFCHIKERTCVLGSINAHHDYFVNRFGLNKLKQIDTTKCTGIGIERLLMTLRAYHPNRVKEILTNAYSGCYRQAATN
jgi:hypothetical protein